MLAFYKHRYSVPASWCTIYSCLKYSSGTFRLKKVVHLARPLLLWTLTLFQMWRLRGYECFISRSSYNLELWFQVYSNSKESVVRHCLRVPTNNAGLGLGDTGNGETIKWKWAGRCSSFWSCGILYSPRKVSGYKFNALIDRGRVRRCFCNYFDLGDS